VITASKRDIVRRALVAVLACAAVTWSLQRCMGAAWGPVVSTSGTAALWSWSGVVLSANLGLLTATRVRRRGVEPGALLSILVVGSLLAVLSLCVKPGMGALLEDLRRVPPLLELDLLLAALPSRTRPLLQVLSACPAPLLFGLLWSERPLERRALGAGLGAILATGAVLVLRTHRWVVTGPFEPAPALDLASWVLSGLSVSLIVASCAGCLMARWWVSGPAWLSVLLALPDPAASGIAELYGASTRGVDLLPTASMTVASAYPLVDLSVDPMRFGGVPLDGTLEGLLAREGLYDFGDPDMSFALPCDRWDLRLQRGLHLAPPSGASVAQLGPTIATIRRFGTSVWLWPGRSPEPLGGPLGPAFAQPAITVLTYPPPDDSAVVAPCWELALTPGTGRLRSVEPGYDRSFELPAQIDALADITEACRGSLVVGPSEDLSVAELFSILDRLAGTDPRATFRGRVALRWPGLDAPFVIEPLTHAYDARRPLPPEGVLDGSGVRIRAVDPRV
jgi:hypothetical protein